MHQAPIYFESPRVTLCHESYLCHAMKNFRYIKGMVKDLLTCKFRLGKKKVMDKDKTKNLMCFKLVTWEKEGLIKRKLLGDITKGI